MHYRFQYTSGLPPTTPVDEQNLVLFLVPQLTLLICTFWSPLAAR